MNRQLKPATHKRFGSRWRAFRRPAVRIAALVALAVLGASAGSSALAGHGGPTTNTAATQGHIHIGG
jgi:hypothetical protein